MGLFSRKSITSLIEEAKESGEHGLKKTLGAWGLLALGVGVIIGAGLFSITGMAAANYAGPSIILSFVIAAMGCGLAGLCYAEFASMIPIAGSAYTYSYATMGEFIAWIIGWDLVLEYAVGAATVASSWAGYLNIMLSEYGYQIPSSLINTPFDGGFMNLPAVIIVLFSSMVLMRGIRESSFVNAIIVILKVGIVLVFIGVGIQYVRPENHTPFIPENQGEFGEFGFSGVIRAAAVVFFAYLGFDAVSTAAQETKNPRRNMPIGILGSLLICTILYVAFAYVMTGVTHYSSFAGDDASSHLAPVAIAIQQMGEIGPDGKVISDYSWLNISIIFAILFGYTSVILVMLLGQSRVFYSMSKDGLVPKMFSEVHSKYKTPVKSNLFFLIVVCTLAAFLPGRIVGEMTSIGTLFAFILVCAGILVMRKTMPDAPRAFKTPFVPFVPILGIFICLFMMVFLPLDTWIRLVVWMIIGLDIYYFYGMRKSKMTVDKMKTITQGKRIVGLLQFFLAILLAVIALIYRNQLIEEDVLYKLSMICSIVHLGFFSYVYFTRNKK